MPMSSQPQNRAELMVIILGLCVLTFLWILNYYMDTLPGVEGANVQHTDCAFRLGFAVKLSWILFCWFVLSRIGMHTVHHFQMRTSTAIGKCILDDSPIFFLVLGCIGSWVHIGACLLSGGCVSNEFVDYYKRDAAYFGFVSVISVVLFAYQKGFLHPRTEDRDREEHVPGGEIGENAETPHFFLVMETFAYDVDKFGDGKHYPSICPICLATWETCDSIKLTPCQHVFHAECLRLWVLRCNACAVCRADLATTTGVQDASNVTSSATVPERVGFARTEIELD